MNATDTYQKIASDAEAIRNDQTQRFPEAASISDYVRQGDLYITLLGEVPDGVTADTDPSPQVAPGNTQGSRHILDSLEGLTIYPRSGNPLLGPVLDLQAEHTLTHPEHGDWVLPIGVYAISYQRAFADELRRRED